VYIMTREENIALNKEELKSKKIVLDSTPLFVNIGTANRDCNANCKFCSGGHPHRFEGLFSLDYYKNFFEKKLDKVMKNAVQVSFCGFGEVLLMPDVNEFLDYINSTIPNVIKQFTTNGSPLLKEGVLEKFVVGKYTLKISLHASNADIHEFVTGMKNFAGIISKIKDLISLREKKGSVKNTTINLVSILNTGNIDDLPRFIELAASLHVDRVICAYMKIFKPEQLDLSCFFDKGKTNVRLDEAKEIADKLNVDAVLPGKFHGELQRGTGKNAFCENLWTTVYVGARKNVQPCCHVGGRIGTLDEDTDFTDVWNNNGFREMREGFVSGNLHDWCKKCLRANRENVDDFNCHLSNDKGSRNAVLEEVKKRGLLKGQTALIN